MDKPHRISDHFAETHGLLIRSASTLGFKNEQELLGYLKGKVVLDLGSGGGGFAKQAYEKLGHGTTIVSMNPRLADRNFLDLHQQEGKLFHFDPQAVEKYTQTAVAADWRHLPFAEESFDSIFATGSFLFYQGTYSDEVMTALIHLLKKSTGELRIELNLNGNNQEIEMAIKKAKQLGCSVRKDSIEDEMTMAGDYLVIKRNDT